MRLTKPSHYTVVPSHLTAALFGNHWAEGLTHSKTDPVEKETDSGDSAPDAGFLVLIMQT